MKIEIEIGTEHGTLEGTVTLSEQPHVDDVTVTAYPKSIGLDDAKFRLLQHALDISYAAQCDRARELENSRVKLRYARSVGDRHCWSTIAGDVWTAKVEGLVLAAFANPFHVNHLFAERCLRAASDAHARLFT